MFDTSKCKRTDFNGTIISKMNRKVLGKMKDELGGQMMTEFVGTGPKNYAFEYLKVDGTMDEKSICKGISKSYTLKFYEHKSVVLGERNVGKKTCFRIGSKEHKLFTIQTNKVVMIAIYCVLQKPPRPSYLQTYICKLRLVPGQRLYIINYS